MSTPAKKKTVINVSFVGIYTPDKRFVETIKIAKDKIKACLRNEACTPQPKDSPYIMDHMQNIDMMARLLQTVNPKPSDTKTTDSKVALEHITEAYTNYRTSMDTIQSSSERRAYLNKLFNKLRLDIDKAALEPIITKTTEYINKSSPELEMIEKISNAVTFNLTQTSRSTLGTNSRTIMLATFNLPQNNPVISASFYDHINAIYKIVKDIKTPKQAVQAPTKQPETLWPLFISAYKKYVQASRDETTLILPNASKEVWDTILQAIQTTRSQVMNLTKDIKNSGCNPDDNYVDSKCALTLARPHELTSDEIFLQAPEGKFYDLLTLAHMVLVTRYLEYLDQRTLIPLHIIEYLHNHPAVKAHFEEHGYTYNIGILLNKWLDESRKQALRMMDKLAPKVNSEDGSLYDEDEESMRGDYVLRLEPFDGRFPNDDPSRQGRPPNYPGRRGGDIKKRSRVTLNYRV